MLQTIEFPLVALNINLFEGPLHFFNEALQLCFFCEKYDRSKMMTDKYLQKDVLNSKFNVESKFEIKMRPFYLKKQKWRRFPVFQEVLPF
jgi:hypothetical protein